jgi:hypothetical protein
VRGVGALIQIVIRTKRAGHFKNPLIIFTSSSGIQVSYYSVMLLSFGAFVLAF